MQKADALEHPFAVVFQGYAPKRMVRFPSQTSRSAIAQSCFLGGTYVMLMVSYSRGCRICPLALWEILDETSCCAADRIVDGSGVDLRAVNDRINARCQTKEGVSRG